MVAQRGSLILPPEQPAGLELRHDEVDEVGQGPREVGRQDSMCASRLKLSAALPAELVTTFQAARPLLRWSMEEKVRATW
jgi:hypothetical protein